MNPQHRHELKNGVLHAVVWLVLACVLLLVLNVANSAPVAKPANKNTLLFPYYGVADVLNSVATNHHAKSTAALGGQLEQLNAATAQYCKTDVQTQPVTKQQLKVQYAKAYLAWLELSAVVMGPMLANNTLRQVDFRPLRATLLERAIEKQPRGAQAMALVGSPAKGFPAYEYLLVHTEFKAGTPQCNYAQEVVLDIARTVADLKWQTKPQTSTTEFTGDTAQATGAGMQLYINQLVGAMHNLAWERMEKPLLQHRDQARARAATAGTAAKWLLSEFNMTEKAWAAQWQGIGKLLLLSSQTVPQADTQVVPLEAYLRGLGKIELADTLAKHGSAVAAAMQATTISNSASVERSVRALKVLKGFVESEVASDLKVSIQFSSSDGD
jgi:uncharacterized protein